MSAPVSLAAEMTLAAVPLAVVTGDAAAAVTLARQLAGHLVADEYAAVDIVEAAPSGERWTVDELVADVLGPAMLSPYGQRRVVIVTAADRMASGAADRLLLAVEEPSAPVTFLLVAADEDLLAVTLRGRSAQTFAAEARWPDGLDEQLAAAVGSEDAGRITSMFGQLPGWVVAAVADTSALDALRHLLMLPGDRPAQDASRIAGQLELLAGFDTTTGEQSGSTADKTARIRRGALAVIGWWRQHMSASVGQVQAEQLGEVARVLDVAELAVRRNVKPLTALSVAASSIAAAAR